jgi:excisionase family DNA binding protein
LAEYFFLIWVKIIMLLNKKAAAQYLGISVETLDKYKDSGKLSYVKIGDRVLWTTDLLDAFIQTCIISATESTTRRESLAVSKAGGAA